MQFSKPVKLMVIVASVLIVYFFTASLQEGIRLTIVLLILASGLWLTEVAPLGITAFIVAFAQPIMGIQSFANALEPFFDPIVVLLLGGFLLARAFERHDLDEVLAYKMVTSLGDNAKTLTLGLMLATAFLSMWISNTASTALMITLALNLTVEAKRDKDKENFSKIIVLGITYSATAGGLATLIGSTPNALAAGMLREMVDYNLTFLGWSFFGMPITIVLILLTWILLFRIFPTRAVKVQKMEQKVLKLNLPQKLTLTIFVLAVILWITGRVPEPIAMLIGWEGHGISTSMVAAFVIISLFLSGTLDQVDIVKVDWNTLLLIGGGLSLGSALSISGVTNWIGQNILSAVGISSNVAVFCIFGFSTVFFSAIASNTASANIFLPIAISTSISTGINPVVLAVFVAICSSLDFMLPVGTPPNAIAYSTGKVRVREMMKAGFILDVLGVLIAIIAVFTFWTLIS